MFIVDCRLLLQSLRWSSFAIRKYHIGRHGNGQPNDLRNRTFSVDSSRAPTPGWLLHMEKAHLDLPRNNSPWRAILRRSLLGLVSLCLLLSILRYEQGRWTSTHTCHHPNGPPALKLQSTSDEFRLVEIHRMGVGHRRNKIYQTLAIPPSSPLHAMSSISDISDNEGKYIIHSTPGSTTHLSNRTRHSIKSYLAVSRLQSSLRNTPFFSSPHTYAAPQFPNPYAEWTTRDIPLPNVTNKASVLTLAKVSSNAYIRIPDTEDWYDIGHKWNESTDFGWEENGLRGHVFANSDNSTIIVAMKGTSPPFVGGSDTSTNDKINVAHESLPQMFSHFLPLA